MELTPKTDQFIKLFKRSIESLNTDWIDLYKRSTIENKHMIAGALKESVRRFILGLTISHYTLLKLGDFLKEPDICTVSENEMIMEFLERNKELYIDAALSGLKTDVSYKDMGDEFWRLCPDINNIDRYINIFRIKYNEIEYIPNPADYDLHEFLFPKSEIEKRIQYLHSLGLITENQFDDICIKLRHIAFNVDCIDCLVADLFNSYKAYQEKGDDVSPNPPSLAFPIEDDELSGIFDNMSNAKNGAIQDNTDFDYFAYAINGKKIPIEKQPFRPINMKLKCTKDTLYMYLLELQKDVEQKTLTIKRRERAGALFTKNGKTIGTLSNPK